MIKNLEVNNSTGWKIDKLLIHKIVNLLKKEFELTISSLLINFISANQIKQINNDFLKHNYSTDIITFNYSKVKETIDGEIYISIDDAQNNARKFGVTFNEEIMRLVTHGFLHLTGYNDEKLIEKRKMKGLENKLFEKYRKFL